MTHPIAFLYTSLLLQKQHLINNIRFFSTIVYLHNIVLNFSDVPTQSRYFQNTYFQYIKGVDCLSLLVHMNLHVLDEVSFARIILPAWYATEHLRSFFMHCWHVVFQSCPRIVRLTTVFTNDGKTMVFHICQMLLHCRSWKQSVTFITLYAVGNVHAITRTFICWKQN